MLHMHASKDPNLKDRKHTPGLKTQKGNIIVMLVPVPGTDLELKSVVVYRLPN